MKKIFSTILLAIIIGIILDFSLALIVLPKLNLGNSGPSLIPEYKHAPKGFPIDFFTGKTSHHLTIGTVGYRILPFNFIINLFIWILVSFLIVFAYKKLNTKNKPR
jgi:hypothetical protein